MTINTEKQTDGHGAGNRATPSHRAALLLKRLSQAVIVLGLLALTRILPVPQALQALVAWVQGLGSFAPAVFIAAYFAATVLMLPAWPLSLAAGVLFGLLGGTLAVATGATLGMASAFIIGRYLARPMVERQFRRYPKFAAIDRAVGEGGWRIVALLRLSPAVPFNLQNYLYGLTAIRFWPCLAASAVGILPGTFMYVYLGYASGAGIQAAGGQQGERGPGQWALLIVGLAATIAVTVYVTRLARRAMREQEGMEEAPASTDTLPAAEERASRNPWTGAVATAAAAVLVTLSVFYAHSASGWLAGVFGPPTVSMTEVYATTQEGPKFDHSTFDALLKEHVNTSGGVDYAAIKANPAPLQNYLDSIASAPFSELGRDEKLALLINAYNAFTITLIAEWLDKGITSIQDIPEDQRWAANRWNIGGTVYSLNDIEHEQIRPKFREPNIHFALVCAAVGCPPLRAEAYAADRIEEQLEDQARIVHSAGSRWFDFIPNSGVLKLTPLYDWYGDDFVQVSGSVTGHAAKYSPALAKATGKGTTPTIAWLDYDWSLNNQENLK